MPNTPTPLDTELRLRRESTAEQVAGAVRDLILSGAVAPQTHLREGPLAQRLGVSRNTVREAVGILVGEGLVTRELHRGAYVADLTVEDVHDLFRVRRLVELTALEHSAGLERLPAVHACIRALESAVEIEDRRGIVEADLEIHRALVDLMDSERLGALYDGVDAELRVCIARTAPAGPNASALLKDHRAILSALERGDSSAAAKRLKRHLDAGERVLVSALQAASAAAVPAVAAPRG